ncbi:MAG: lysophospholipase [Oscillospiraceae bacterium]|nr:lysophospholipase [Oscillospiraceae bacterium]
MEQLEVLQNFFAMEKARKAEAYRRLNRYVKKGQIVFAGSSLMEQFPIYEFIQDLDIPYTIYNRGIGGYTTREMREMLDVRIYDLAPRYLILNIGTNDLPEPDYTPEALIARYEWILGDIRAHLPEVKIALLAYYPANVEAAMPQMREMIRRRNNDRIREANAAVASMAQRAGVRYWDVNAHITAPNGDLMPEYTVDGIHMYADGYYQVLRALLPRLKELVDGD